jgi:hypothetical protein
MDALGQQNVALGQRNVSLGQQFDAFGQKGDEEMQEMDSLKTKIHDLKQTMENMKAFITQIDGLQPDMKTKTTNVQQNSAMLAEAEGPTTASAAGRITSEAMEIDGYVDEDGNTVQITTLLDTDPDAQDGAIVQIEEPRLGFASQFSCVPSCKVSECKPCDTGAVVAPAVVRRQ